MQFKFFLAASAASVSLACGLAAPAYAQETSSAVRGTVTGDAGPVAGATVTVVHEPSGTTLSTTTAADGTFAANGLRVGGPFTVTVDANGFDQTQVTELYLQAGNPARLPITLQKNQDLVVTATTIQPKIALTDGPTTALGRTEIDGAASVNRDIRDLARRDPLATIDLTNGRTIEIAGNNGRLNRFSVDGMTMSDDFGLNNGGLPTNRGPVPFDAIEQFSVKVAPYDIAEGDMQGGAINVVLRSGSNKLHGGGFYSYTGDGLTGSRSRAATVKLNFDSNQYGGWLSGPLIKDKLFFMVAYERTKEGQPLDAGFGTGFATQVPGLTQSLIDSVSATAQSRYGYDTLGLISTTNEGDEKIVTKLDWNLSDSQRASVTYIRNVGTNQFQQGTFLGSSPSLGYQSNGYELREEINSGTFELNSTWTDTISTTARVSYRDYNRGQTPFGASFPQFTVCTDAASAGSVTSCAGTTLVFGPDISRHSNALNTENFSVDLTGRVEFGDHSMRLMAGYTNVHVYNLFVQRSLGEYYFDSLADFNNGRLSQLGYSNAVPSNDPNNAAAAFSTRNWTFGIQDEWQVTDTLAMTVGLRYDLFENNQLPALNRNFTNRVGFSNLKTFNGLGLFQPRFALNWNPTDRLAIKLGVGIFGGGTPDVFLSNVYSNTGQLTNRVTLTQANCAASGATCGALNGVTNGTIAQSVINFLTTNTASLATAPTDVIDPKLNIASKMKFTAAIDYEADLGPLGDGWLVGLQFVYDKTLDGYLWTDLRSVPLNPLTVGILPDGRTRYGPIGGVATTNRDLMLTNTEDGRGIFGTFRIEKRFGDLNVDASYTRSDVKDRSSLTSSTSSSNYNNNAFENPNLPAYGRSIYEYTDQIKFGMNYRHAFFGENKTTIGVFGEYRTGRPYSVTMLDATGTRGTVFGTVGNLGNMLLYVPTVGDTKVTFDTTTSQTNFNNLVTTLGLDEYRGKIVPKNSQSSPSFFKIDLHFGQELPVPMVPGMKLEVFADVENVLNMINKDWGSLRQVQFPYNAAIVRVQCLNVTTVPTGTAPTAGQINTSSTQPCAQYRYSSVVAPAEILQTRQSLYAVRVGVRIKF
ncbi:carboxypeptidase regulatory-like domain-containing protein [Novosphingobium sp.]|uniref:TonB-dependent receptor n=1 Tax=Novosphingobium sp. TaxID=1874826 RepID=UPI00286B4AD8|nr:carboxypeptidase regulatory-like domain-containing protein [Novosphingobium sp.]